ncbi:Peptidase A5, thermopsin, partial [mine drainage metagenome]
TLNSINTFLLTNDGSISTNGSQNTFGVQLNAVTNGTTVGTNSSYSFWTQNVLYFNFPSPGMITFLDNIWNFSSPAVSLTAGTLYSYNGTPCTHLLLRYRPVTPDHLPDHRAALPELEHDEPSLHGVRLLDREVRLQRHRPNIGNERGFGVYDTVLFNSATRSVTSRHAPY